MKIWNHLKETQGVPKLDESWNNNYDKVDLAAYDFVVGKLYENYGYKRGEFDEHTIINFRKKYSPPQTPEDANKLIKPWRPSNIKAKVAAIKRKIKQYIDTFLYLIKSIPSRIKS